VGPVTVAAPLRGSYGAPNGPAARSRAGATHRAAILATPSTRHFLGSC
jgi:hypothetical protein